MKKVNAKLVVNINVNASELADTSSPRYAEWVRLSEEAVSMSKFDVCIYSG